MSVIAIEQELALPPEARRGLRWWHMLIPPAFVVVFALLAGITTFIARRIAIHLGYSVWGWGVEARAFRHSTAGALVSGALVYSILLAGLWFALRHRGERNFAGYFAPVSRTQLWKAALSGVLLAALFIGTAYALTRLHAIAPKPTESVRIVTAHTVGQLFMSLGVAAILGPLGEEVYFRGMLLSWLRQRLSWTYAAAITAILFSLIHGFLFTQPLTAAIFFSAIIATLGYVNALWLAKTGSMWVPFTVHASYNGVIVLLASFAAMSGVT